MTAVYDPSGLTTQWCSGTANPQATATAATAAATAVGPAGYRLLMQDDGNVVIYDKDNQAIWSTKTGRMVEWGQAVT